MTEPVIETGAIVTLDWPGHANHGKRHEVREVYEDPGLGGPMAEIVPVGHVGYGNIAWPLKNLRLVEPAPKRQEEPMARRVRNGNDVEEVEDDPPPQQHNAKARKATIKKAMRQITELESQRREIGEQIRSVKQTLIKGDLGMKIGDFNAALRLYQLEGEDREQFFDTLRETFEALNAGDQLDFIESLGRIEPGAEQVL